MQGGGDGGGDGWERGEGGEGSNNNKINSCKLQLLNIVTAKIIKWLILIQSWKSTCKLLILNM